MLEIQKHQWLQQQKSLQRKSCSPYLKDKERVNENEEGQKREKMKGKNTRRKFERGGGTKKKTTGCWEEEWKGKKNKKGEVERKRRKKTDSGFCRTVL